MKVSLVLYLLCLLLPVSHSAVQLPSLTMVSAVCLPYLLRTVWQFIIILLVSLDLCISPGILRFPTQKAARPLVRFLVLRLILMGVF